MHFLSTTAISTLALALLSAGPATARIIGIRAPTTIVAGQSFPVSILTENYIQSVEDVSAAWGIFAGAGIGEALGQFLDAKLLTQYSNTPNPIPFTLTAPSYLSDGEATVSAGITSLYGAGYMPTVEIFNVSVTFGDSVSTETVDSQGWYQPTGFQWVG